MDTLTRNLHSLHAEFHDKGKAGLGAATLRHYIDRSEDTKLAHLLRDHKEEPVFDEELERRFEADALIEYYNLLFIAALAGYVPPTLDKDMADELRSILDHPSVTPYYRIYYPYKLAEYTLLYAAGRDPFDATATPVTLSAFHDFISLNRTLKRDKDLERFLGMLDHVVYGGYAIGDVIDTLSSPARLEQAFTTKEKTEAERATWGFFKFTGFASQFRDLLETLDERPLLQSAMWLYHGYYFDRMNDRLRGFFNIAFKHIKEALSQPEVYRNLVPTELSEGMEGLQEPDWKGYAEDVVSRSRADVEAVLNQKWKVAMKEHFGS
jgi:hypothetical protein